jgi:regulator of RNase E activity RraA
MNDIQLFEALGEVDTPTVCNALEIVMGGRTASGFTTRRVVPMDADLPPMVGYAVTAKLRASAPSEEHADGVLRRRLDYYRMVGEAAARQPTVVVIEDTDDPPGLGAFWGEVNVAMHLGLGVKGVLTNGSMRDLGDVDEGFQVLAGTIGPSHAHVHVTDLAVPVTVLGLGIAPGDLIHADRHGAVVIRPEHTQQLPQAIDDVKRNEAPILEAARAEGFDLPTLLQVWSDKDDVH